MRKFYSFLLATVALLCSTAANAQSFTIDDVNYTVISSGEKTAAITSSNWPAGTLTIPATVTYESVNYTVTEINDLAFQFCVDITGWVTLPATIKSIGGGAFADCSNITAFNVAADNANYVSVNGVIYTKDMSTVVMCPNAKTGTYTIADGVTTIAWSSFDGCSQLDGIIIPSTVTTIGATAFCNCSSLTQLTIPASVTSVSYDTFGTNDADKLASLKNLTLLATTPPSWSDAMWCLPEGATVNVPAEAADAYATTGGWSSVNTAAYDGKCGDNAFWTLNEGALTIFGTGAMYYYTDNDANRAPWYSDRENISSVTVEEGVTSIGGNAFRDCTGLTSVDIPEGVTSIGDFAFHSCSNLTSVDIPEGVTSIGWWAFCGCTGLTSVDIPEGVTSIGLCAFYGCTGLTSIKIPGSVTIMQNQAFESCSSLTSIIVDEENTVYDSRGNCNAIIETASNTLLYGCENTVIPSSVTSIGGGAFLYCSGLTSIEIPSSVTSIGESAFWECTGLTSIVSHIAAEDLFAPGENAFYGVDKDACTLYVPAGAKSTYESTDGWKEFTNIVEFNGKCGDDAYWALNEETGALTIFGEGAMYNYANNDANRAPWYADRENISSVSIGSGITVIGKWALAGCLFTSIELPNTLTTIKEEAFSDCSALTSITIPASVTSIEDYVFGCKSLETIVVEAGNTVYDSRNNCNAIMETSTNKLIAGSSNTVIPEETVSIGHYAFENRALTSIEIPANVTSIGNYAFLHTKLENIVIPNNVNYLGVGVFQACDNLVSAKLPDNLTYINKNLFYQCTSLTDIEIPETVTNIDYAAFYLCSFTDINIPESVTNIGDYAFAGCWNLNKITIPASVTNIGILAFSNCGLNVDFEGIVSHIAAEDLFAPGNKAFNGIDKDACTLYVPAGAKSTYESTDGWKDFTNIVEAYDLTVTAAGYATMYLDKAVEIPAGVEAYTAGRIEGDLLKMQAVEDVIPANTAVIIKAEEGNYSFAYSDETPDAIEGNLLRGTLTDTYIKPAGAQSAYVLSVVDGVVGMYRAKLKANGTFKNNANRVYMLLGEINVGEGDLDTSNPGGQLSNGYRFDFSGTTAIESVETESAAPAVYYDLSGRRVENPAKGIYIVNGRKVFIK